MKSYVAISKELKDTVDEVTAYLEETKLHESAIPPFKKMGEGNALANALPSLYSELEAMNLSVKSLHLYSVYFAEIVTSSTEPFIIVPLVNFDTMHLVVHTLKENAVDQLSVYTGSVYHELYDAIEVEKTLFNNNTMYFVNSNVHTSSRYKAKLFYQPADLGLFLTIFVNEDLSSYFTE